MLSHQALNVLADENFAYVRGDEQTVEILRCGQPPLEGELSHLVNLVVNFEDELMFFFIDSQNLSLDFFVIVHVIVVLKDCWRKGNDLFWDKCNVFLFFAKFSTTFVGLVLKMGVS